jgi:hypothetical protein
VAPIVKAAQHGVRARTRIQDGRIEEVVEPRQGGPCVPAMVAAPKPHRQRHDGFTPKKQRKFFKALKKTGCLTDACRAAGISRNTVRRHRDKWPAFDHKVGGALAIASMELEMIAWKRATEGVEEKVYRDGRLVFTRIKPSDSILRLLLKGANPKKYGSAGFSRKRLRAWERKQIEEEVRAEIRAKRPTFEESMQMLDTRLRALGLRHGIPADWDAAGPDE